jgi:hypothetical protein
MWQRVPFRPVSAPLLPGLTAAGLSIAGLIAVGFMTAGLAGACWMLIRSEQGPQGAIVIGSAALILAFTCSRTGWKQPRALAWTGLALTLVLTVTSAGAVAAPGTGLGWTALIVSSFLITGTLALARTAPEQDAAAFTHAEPSPSSAATSEEPALSIGETSFDSRSTGEAISAREQSTEKLADDGPHSPKLPPLRPLDLFAAEEDTLELEEDLEECEEATAVRPQQSLTRSWSEGLDQLDGQLAVQFLPGQRQTYVHVAFVPVFHQRPDAFCTCESAVGIQAEFDLLHPFGGRMCVRRQGDPSEALEVDVLFAVSALLPARRVA